MQRGLTMVSKITPVKYCPICGRVVSRIKKQQKYCGAVCAAIVVAKSRNTKFIDGLTIEQARHWYLRSSKLPAAKAA